MKKVIKQIIVFSLMFFFFSCTKEGHTIRLKNNFSEQINNVKIGTASIGNVASGVTSGYKSIHTGNFSVSGSTTSGKVLTGSGSLSGKGKHKWTATVSSSGVFTIQED